MVTVFGLGFVGLTTALGFAHLGYKVYGIDVDHQRRETLQNGKLPFLEPQMEDELKHHLNKNFIITEDIEQAVSDSEYIFYCVGTPYGKEGSADLTYLFSAIDTTIAAIKDERYRILITKSTIPPSTTAEKIYPYIQGKGQVAQHIGIANNPEFLREGHCWDDFIHADRIVLGCNDTVSEKMLKKLYEPMGIPIYCVSYTTSEFIKYLSNTLLATMISYSNEMSHIADTIGGIDVADAFHILHMDKRWNHCDMTSYVYPGCGYGGYCLPKDTCALFAQSVAKGFEPPILKHVIETNQNRAKIVAEKIIQGQHRDDVIGILGLSFKPGSDDVRDSAAYKVIKELQNLGYNKIVAFDPAAMQEFRRAYPDINIQYLSSAEEVYNCSNIVAMITAWDSFLELAATKMEKTIDCRYALSRSI